MFANIHFILHSFAYPIKVVDQRLAFYKQQIYTGCAVVAASVTILYVVCLIHLLLASSSSAPQLIIAMQVYMQVIAVVRPTPAPIYLIHGAPLTLAKWLNIYLY